MNVIDNSRERTVDIVIPTYQRGHVLLDTIEYLRSQAEDYISLIIVDQTKYVDDDNVAIQLQDLADKGFIHWVREDTPSIPNAMNIGLLTAQSDLVLFLDDDIIPADNLVSEHIAAHLDQSIVASVGQILQPNEQAKNVVVAESSDRFDADLLFPFYSSTKQYIRNCMAGNLCVNRNAAIACGGFDTNFINVAYRFETEFCRRLLRHSQARFLFFPTAVIHHLKVPSGGTRSHVKNFLCSIKPGYCVGEYYFVLCETSGFTRLYYILKTYIRAPKARFYVFKPWWIPVRMIAEARGLYLALKLFWHGPRHIKHDA